MLYGIWQLTRQSLTSDVRRSGSHAIRFGLSIVLYFAVCYACFLSWSNASGLPLFQAQLMITALFLSATAIFGFSQTITEEKEEETLGLMRLADISPLAIILGKTMGILCDAALLIAIQYPFTVVAITLGGVSWAQVYAAYIALAAYLWLLAMVGITVSVFQPNGGKAAKWTAIFVAAYSLPYFFLWAFGTLWGWKALQTFWPISLPMRMLEITESGFQDSPLCLAVVFSAIVGFLCLILSWLAFDRFALTEARDDRPLELKLTPRRSRRPWPKPIIWREYIFATGGIPWTIMRIGVQLAIFFAVLTTFQSINRPGGHIGFTFAWSAIFSGLFGILDGTWFASKLFQDEVRNRTWSALVQTPHTLPQLALEKCCGWAVGLAPTIISPFGLPGAHDWNNNNRTQRIWISPSAGSALALFWLERDPDDPDHLLCCGMALCGCRVYVEVGWDRSMRPIRRHLPCVAWIDVSTGTADFETAGTTGRDCVVTARLCLASAETKFCANSSHVHLILDLFNWRICVMPVHTVDAGRTDAAEDDFWQERRQRMSGIHINCTDKGPVHSKTVQTGFHQVHHESRFDLQSLIGRIA